MAFIDDLKAGKEKIAVTGLGYVGMPLAVAFAKKAKVVGFDVSSRKIRQYLNGIDVTQEVGDEVIKTTTVQFTDDEKQLEEARFHIIAVPTPISSDKTPDLTPVASASEIVGRHLKKGSYVVYESTVYPGVTEEICLPILEKESGLKCGEDFKIGYSPERINPGDKINRLETITKIVSGMDEASLETIAQVYEMVVDAGVYRAESIKVAEAAKVVENSQRDINIAFMNELAIAFDMMGIDTNEVVKAMNTKWNALKFYPGLVGGHCIGVDPYYFVYRAEQLGYRSQIIAAGRKVNDDMGKFVGNATIKQLIAADKKVKGAKVAVLGFTFKENCPDVRNSKVIDIIQLLCEYGIDVQVCDPVADQEEAYLEYGISLSPFEEIKDVDAIILAVAHNDYKQLSLDDYGKLYKDEKVIIDVKSILSPSEALSKGFKYWNL